MLLVALGVAGAGAVIAAYGLLAAGRLRADDSRYQWLNVGGTAGILLSLLAEWNAAAFLTNIAWISIGIVGLVRTYCRKKSA